jgi:putative transcriptional regulator
MKIYNRLSILRAEHGISRADLAEKVSVNIQTIGFIERGDYYPSLELAMQLADVFGLEVSDVFSKKEFIKKLPQKG